MLEQKVKQLFDNMYIVYVEIKKICKAENTEIIDDHCTALYCTVLYCTVLYHRVFSWLSIIVDSNLAIVTNI